MGECRLLVFLAIGHVLSNLWHFEFLTLESMGKPKMWNILKMADRRAKRELWHVEIFLNTGPYAELEISKCFHWSPSKLYDNIGYHDKSKCLLEYCNEKLASST